MRTSTSGTVACAVALVALGAAAAATQDPIFHARIDVVRVDVSILDRNRLPVTDLRAADFTIRDDGRERPVVAFSRVTVPVAPAATNGPAASTAADGSDATKDFDAEQPGRLVAVLFDRTIPAGESTVAARQVATALVNGLGLQDYAAILRSSGFTDDGKSQEFTQDRRALLAAIARPFIGMTSLPIMTLRGLMEGGRDQLTGECQCGSCSMDAIAAVARAIQSDTGRRKMLVFIGSDLPHLFETQDCARISRERMFRELDQSNLTVHVLDPSGLEAGGVPAGSFNRLPDQAESFVAQHREDRRRRQENLAVLPERTGGRLVTNTNNPEAFVAQILGESRTYYLLGFQPVASTRNGQLHRIEVNVARSGVRVIARKSYAEAPH
jgi:VWFA-related protein